MSKNGQCEYEDLDQTKPSAQKKNRQQNRPKSKADHGRNNNDKLAEAYSPFDKKRVSHNGDRLAPTSSIFDKKNSSITSASLS